MIQLFSFVDVGLCGGNGHLGDMYEHVSISEYVRAVKMTGRLPKRNINSNPLVRLSGPERYIGTQGPNRGRFSESTAGCLTSSDRLGLTQVAQRQAQYSLLSGTALPVAHMGGADSCFAYRSRVVWRRWSGRAKKK